MCAESEVGCLGEFKGLSLEALCPFILCFVLELDFERRVLVIGHTHLLGHRVGTPNTTGLGFLCQYKARRRSRHGSHTEQPAISLSFPS